MSASQVWLGRASLWASHRPSSPGESSFAACMPLCSTQTQHSLGASARRVRHRSQSHHARLLFCSGEIQRRARAMRPSWQVSGRCGGMLPIWCSTYRSTSTSLPKVALRPNFVLTPIAASARSQAAHEVGAKHRKDHVSDEDGGGIQDARGTAGDREFAGHRRAAGQLTGRPPRCSITPHHDLDNC
jgi:hypothetical protein